MRPGYATVRERINEYRRQASRQPLQHACDSRVERGTTRFHHLAIFGQQATQAVDA